MKVFLQKLALVSVIAVGLLFSSGCATTSHPCIQKEAVNTTPVQGAALFVDGELQGITPCTAYLECGSEHKLELRLAGYKAVTISTVSDYDPRLLLSLGLYGVPVLADIRTGAYKRFQTIPTIVMEREVPPQAVYTPQPQVTLSQPAPVVIHLNQPKPPAPTPKKVPVVKPVPVVKAKVQLAPATNSQPSTQGAVKTTISSSVTTKTTD